MLTTDEVTQPATSFLMHLNTRSTLIIDETFQPNMFIFLGSPKNITRMLVNTETFKQHKLYLNAWKLLKL